MLGTVTQDACFLAAPGNGTVDLRAGSAGKNQLHGVDVGGFKWALPDVQRIRGCPVAELWTWRCWVNNCNPGGWAAIQEGLDLAHSNGTCADDEGMDGGEVKKEGIGMHEKKSLANGGRNDKGTDFLGYCGGVRALRPP